MRVLVTRPEPGASATAARLTAMGHEPVMAPCLRIMPRPAKLPENPAAIIVTSMNAIPALPVHYRQIPVFCVGDATAGRLRQAGFSSVESAGGDADDLFRLITARALPGLHFMAAAARQGFKLAGMLRDAGVELHRCSVYAAQPVQALPEAAKMLLAAGQIGAALFYSAETAKAFSRLTPPGTASVTALVLSQSVAKAVHGLPWAQIRVALVPTEADLLALL